MEFDHRLNTTDQDLVRRAASPDEQVRRSALNHVLRIYLPPLRTHVFFKFKLDWHTAEDIVQGFAADRMICNELCRNYDSNQGRFRTYLLSCLDNYTKSELRTRVTPESLVEEPAGKVAVDAFQLSWAREVLKRTIEKMHEECLHADRELEWRVFDARILSCLRDGNEPRNHDELARELCLDSRRQSENMLITAKRRFQRCLRSVIEEYTIDADSEIRSLKQVICSGTPLHLEASLRDLEGVDDDSLSISITFFSNQELQSLVNVEATQIREFCELLLSKPLEEVLTADDEKRFPKSTLGHVLLDECDLDLLSTIKRDFRKRARIVTGVESQAAKVIYLSAIAAAVVKMDERISKSPPHVLAEGIQSILENDWNPEELGSLLSTAAAKLQHH